MAIPLIISTPKAIRFNTDVSVKFFLTDEKPSAVCSTTCSFEPLKELSLITKTSLLKAKSNLHLKQNRLQEVLDTIDDLIYDYQSSPLTRSKKNNIEGIITSLADKITPIAIQLRSLNLDPSYDTLKSLITTQINKCLFIVKKMAKLRELSKLT